MTVLNFNHLYNFWVIAKEGSIVKASKKLHVTQPTLSTQLKNLEDSFGKRLFDRKVRKLVLNQTGKIAFDYANRIFNLRDEMIKSLNQYQTKKMIVLGIGSVPTLPRSYVHEFTLPLWQNKKIVVRTRDSKLSELIIELEQGFIDIILSDMKGMTFGKKIINHRLASRRIIVAAHPKFAKARKTFPKSLNGLPFINYSEESNVRGEIDYYFKKNNLHPEIIGEIDDISLLKMTAVKGLCFIIVPENAVTDELNKKRLVKLGTINSIETGIWAITRTMEKTPEPILRAIKRFHKTA